MQLLYMLPDIEFHPVEIVACFKLKCLFMITPVRYSKYNNAMILSILCT